MTFDEFTDSNPEPQRTNHIRRNADRGGPGRTTRTTLGLQERQAVLVDARFWSWLHDDDGAPAGNPQAAQDALQALLAQTGSRLVRTLWFTDQDGETAVPGLQFRRVPSNAQDRGVTMLRAMAQDLLAMAERRAVERVLLVTDDDRLLLAVDEAQRHGLQIDMLVDADSQDLKALRDEDPNWASLLQSADRLVALGGSEVHSRGAGRPRGPMSAEHRQRREPPSAEASGIIEDEVLNWWDDETPDQRDHWRQEMQTARGVPQELDRQLLLRISRRLGHPLSPSEKAMMRQQVRRQIAGDDHAAAPTSTPTDA